MRRRKKSFRKRRIFIVLLLIIIGILVYQGFQKEDTENYKSNTNVADNKDVTEEIKDDKINIAVVGDIMCHNTQFQDAYNKGTDSYDFSYVFEDVKDYLSNPDLTIGNLETTLSGKSVGYSGYPTFNTPEALAQNLKDYGVDILSTVNNHCMDKGIKGLQSTIDELDKWGFYHTGTFKTKESSESPLVVEKNGIRFGIIAYTYGTNGIAVPASASYSVNLIENKDKMVKDIERIKEEKVDVIIAIMHWGIEYQTEPNKEQKDLADFLFNNGVDIILGGHPHVLQTMEKREIKLEDGTKKDGFIVYSLGNFISGQVKTYTKQSVILNIGLTKHNNPDAEKKITIDDVSYVPVYMYDSKGSPRYKLLDIRKNMKAYENGESGISKSLYDTLQSEVEHIYWIMGDEIHKDF